MTRLQPLLLLVISSILCDEPGPVLDDLKADILKYVLDNDNEASDNRTAVEILQFILGTRTGTTEEEWEVAKQVVDNDPEAPSLPEDDDELNDIIGLYQDTFEEYNDIENTFEDYDSFSSYEDQFSDYSSFQEDNSVSVQNTFENPDYQSTIIEAFEEYNEIDDTPFFDNDGDDLSCSTEDEEGDGWRVLETRSFSMSPVNSEDSSVSASIEIQHLDQTHHQARLLCNFSTPSSSPLFSFDSCVPEIYLVSGQSSCSVSSLPASVSAQKLAEIHQTGYGESLINISWEILDKTCILIVTRRECSQGSDQDDEIATTTAESSSRNIFRQNCGSIRTASATSQFRVFSTINLSGFNILLTGGVIGKIKNI